MITLTLVYLVNEISSNDQRLQIINKKKFKYEYNYDKIKYMNTLIYNAIQYKLKHYEIIGKTTGRIYFRS